MPLGQQMLLRTYSAPGQCAGCWRPGENGSYKPNSLQSWIGFLSLCLCLSLGFAVPDWALCFLVLPDGSWLCCMELGRPDSGRKARGVVGRRGFGPQALGILSAQVGSCGRGFWRALSPAAFADPSQNFLFLFTFPIYLLCTLSLVSLLTAYSSARPLQDLGGVLTGTVVPLEFWKEDGLWMARVCSKAGSPA